MTLRFILPCVTLVVTMLLLFTALGRRDLEKYDEARRAVSATEMAGGGSHFLVPTYNFRPDRWGTKPPLLIWLQAAAIRVFGKGEFAVRLPSAVATGLLIGLMLWWSRRAWGGYAVGAIAGLFVLTSADYLGNHGGRSGDYDALLVLFLLAQTTFLYRYIARGKFKYLIFFGLALTLAGWTKGIAGCFFLPGFGLWLLLDESGRKALKNPSLYVTGICALAAIFSYYPLREALDPGFMAQVWENELGGRFAARNEGHGGPAYFYLRELLLDPGNGWLAVLGGAAGALIFRGAKQGPERLIFMTLVCFLLVISAAETKLYWYKSPALPLLGLLLGSGVQRIMKRWKPWVMPLAIIVLFAYPLITAWQRVTNAAPIRNFAPATAPYATLEADTAFIRPYKLLLYGYQPQARFYVGDRKEVQLAYSELPIAITVNDRPPPAEIMPGDLVVLCSTPDWEYLFERYEVTVLTEHGPCMQVSVRSVKAEN